MYCIKKIAVGEYVMVVRKSYEINRSIGGILLAFLPIMILLLAGIQSGLTANPTIVDNGDYTFTATWDFTDLTNYTLTNVTSQNGELNLTTFNYFWNESNSMDFSGGQRTNVVEGDGVVISTDDLILGQIINQNFSTPYNWNYTNGTGNNVNAQWSSSEYGWLYSIPSLNVTYQNQILQPGAVNGIDTYLNENSPGTNYGTDTYVRVEKGTRDRNSLLWFDVSSLTDVKVVDAQLELYMYSSEDAVSSLDISAHRVTQPWAENDATWDNRDIFNFWVNPGGDYNPAAEDTVFGLTNNYGWKSWNITTLVDGWADGTFSNRGVLLYATSGANTWKQFYSSDYFISTRRPRLTIEYYELNSFNETSNITQVIPILDPGAYMDSSVGDFEAGIFDDTSVIPGGGGQVTLSSLGYSDFDLMESVSEWNEDSSTNKNSGSYSLSNTIFYEGAGSMELLYDFAQSKHKYGVLRNAITSWDWSRFSDISVWALSSGLGEVMKIILEDSWGTSWESSLTPLTNAWTNYTFDITTFPGDSSNIDTIRLHFTDTTGPIVTYIDNITLLGGAPYFTQGTYTSRVMDGEYPADWETITWSESIPGPTSLQIITRTGNTSIPDASWSPWSAPYATPSGSSITNPMGRYIQYEVNMNTLNSDFTPTLSEVTLVKSEYNMTFTYSVDTYTNIDYAYLFLKLNDLLLWDKVVSATSPPQIITFDIGRYLFDVGDSKIEFGLTVEGDTELNRDISATLDDFQIKGPAGFYTSKVHDAGSEAIWANVTWNADIPPTTQILLQTRSSSDNISWSPWSAPIATAIADITNPIGRYIQYKVNFTTENKGITPIFKDINITYSKYSPIGSLTFTTDLVVQNITNWGVLSTNWTLRGQDIRFEYSIDSGFSWNPVASDLNLSSVSIFTNKIRFRVIMETFDTSLTPTLYSLELTYSVNHPPTILGVIPNQTWPEDGGPWTLDLTPYESDYEDPGNKLKWHVTMHNSSLYTLDGEYSLDDVLTFTPLSDVFGDNLVRIWVEDSFGATTYQEVWINITPVNDAPQIMGVIPSYDKTENDPNWQIDLLGYKYDIDNLPGELSWSVFGWDPSLFDSVSIAGNIMTFDLAPDAYGTDEMTVVLNDAMYAVNQNLWVNVSFINKAPVISAVIPNFNVLEDDPGWIFDLTSYEWDREDPYPSAGLSWSVWGVNSSLYSYSLLDNNITFTPHPDVYGDNEITITLTDSLGASSSQKIWVNISSQNDAPQIFGVIPNFDVDEDDADWNYDLSIYKSDIDNSTGDLYFSVAGWDPLIFDSVSLVGDTLFFDLALEGNGNDEITIILSDGILTDTQNIWVNVTPDNDIPSIVGVIPNFDKNEDDLSWTLDLTSYEYDPEDGSPSPQLVWSVLGVDSDLLSTTILDNNVTFTLDQDAYGDNEITLILTDSLGQFVSQKIWVNVTAQNDAPNILGIIPNFDKNEDAANWQWDLSGYKSDVDNLTSELSWSLAGIDPLLFDSVSLIGDVITFDLAAHANGDCEITVTLSDGLLFVSQKIWVNITAINDAPVIIGTISDFLKNEDDTSWSLDLTLRESDSEDGGPSSQLEWSVLGVDPTLLNIGIVDNNLTFTLMPDAFGNNEITLILMDSLGATDSTSFWVNVTPENDAPSIQGFIPSFQKIEDAVDWSLDLSVYKYDIDNTSAELSWSVMGWDITLFDSVYMVGDILFFDLAQNATGSDQITLILSDGILTDSQDIWVNVSQFNDAPSINGLIGDFDKNEDDLPWTIDLTTLEYDTEDAFPSLNLVWSVTNVDWNLMSVAVSDNNITFTLQPHAFGSNEITIILTDSGGKSDSQKIWINVSSQNDGPQILGVIPDFTYDEDAQDWSLDLAPYKWDVDNTPAQLSWLVSQWDPLLFDSVSVVGDTLSFDLAQDAFGSDQITLTLSDGSLQDVTQFSVDINPVNDAPSIIAAISDIHKQEDDLSWEMDLSAFKSDVEDSPIQLLWSVSNVDSSLLSITVTNDILNFTLVPDAYGYDFITITLTDSGGLWDSQDILIDIASVNDVPFIQPAVSNIVTDEDTGVSINLSSYANDIEDPAALLHWFISGSDSSLYSWRIDPRNMNLYIDPLPNMYGTDNVVLNLMDSQGATTSQALQIVIISVNDAPYISPQVPESLFETLEDEAISVIFTGFENDIEDSNNLLTWDVENVDTSIIRISLSTLEDKLVIIPVVIFSPDDSESIETQITLVLWDSQGLSSRQDMTVRIIPVNNAPQLDILPDIVIKFDKSYEFDLTPYAFDEDTDLADLILTTSEPDSDTGSGYIAIDGLKMTFLYPVSRVLDQIAVLVTLSDGLLSDYAILQVTISDHTPPELITQIPNISFDEDTSLEDAFDLDDHFRGYEDGALNYSYYMAYTHHGDEFVFVTINKNNSVDFSSALDWFGIEYITFRAEDGYQAIAEATITVLVSPVNDAPVIMPIPDQMCKVNVSKTLDISSYISDPDTSLESLMIATDSLYIITQGHELVLTYDDITTEVVNIIVSDGYAQNGITIEVSAQANQPPYISNIPDLVVRGGEVYLFSLLPYVTDFDNELDDLLIWTDSPYINPNNGNNLLFQIDYPNNMTGQEDLVTIYVSDGQDTTSTQVPIRITDEMVPILLSNLPNLFFEEDLILYDVIDLTDYFENADEYQFFGNDKVNISIEDGMVTVSAQQDWSGTERITFRAILDDAFVEDTIEVIVKPIDDPPVLTPLPSYDKKVDEIWILNLDDYISDIDTPITGMSISVDSPYVILYAMNIYFQYQFPINDVITITVSDGINTVSGVLYVNVTYDNNAPSYTGLISTEHIKVGDTWTLDLDDYFYDLDDDTLIFSCNREEIIINPITHEAEWTPTSEDNTLEGVIFYASDGTETIESSPVDIVVNKDKTTPSSQDQFWWIILLLAIIISILLAYVFLLRGEEEEEEEEYDLPVAQAVEYLSVHGGGNYIIKSSTSDKAYRVFSGMLKKGFEGLCITTKAPDELTNNYDLGKAWIIKLALRGQKGVEGEDETQMMGLLALGDEDREDDKYIFSLNFNRIVETIEEFLTTGEKKVVLLDGLEYILGGEELIMYIGFIAALRERLKERNSCLLIPVDPKTLSEKELGLLERETEELGKVISEKPKGKSAEPMEVIDKSIKSTEESKETVSPSSSEIEGEKER
jgi:hypothetical protein